MNVTQTDRQHAAIALELLKKVALTGAEVPSFVAVNNWLHDIVGSGNIRVGETVEVSPAALMAAAKEAKATTRGVRSDAD